jgi:DNA invertase Pin-like site-specific DNA recombinase
VYRLDRLTRSGIRDTLGLLEELRGAGCHVVTVADGFELGGPAGDVVIAVIAWAAQMERAAIGERIRAARARVEAAKGAWGRPRRVAGELERRVFELRHRGRTVRAIAVALKVPRATVQDALTRSKQRR